MPALPCFLCGRKLEKRTSKRQKPYFVCDPCGIQLFIRRKQGIERLEALFRNAEAAKIPFQQHNQNFHEMLAILKEIEDVKQKRKEISSFFLSDEQIRTRKLLKIRLDNLFYQLEQFCKKRI